MTIKPKSIKINYILNLTRLALNMLVLGGTMPYISRIFGSEGIGKVEYPNTIVEYIILFSALGIPLYGIRQIAQCRDDIRERSKVMIELSVILTITTLLAYVFLFVFQYFGNDSAEFKNMLMFLSISIFLSNFGFEWFYQGIEDQKYITIRHIFVKIIALILLFVLVKTEQDIYYYALFLIVSTFGGSLFNIFNLRKYIVFDKEILSGLDFKRHLKPSLTILAASISVSIYMLLDKLMLGSMVSESAVGYYTQAVKLPRLMLVLVTAMGAVMLPRLANLLGNDKKEEYERYMDKSLKYIVMVAVPATVLFMVLAKEIILVMAGDKFIPSIRTMQIIAPIIFIVALAYYVGFQVLYPLGKEKIYTISVTIAAVVNLVFNLFTIESMEQDGAALGTLIAEIVGLSIMIYATRTKLLETGFFRANNLKYIVAGALMAVAAYFSTYFNLEPLFTLFVSVSIGMAVYTLALFAMKEVIVHEVLAMAKGFLKK